VAPLNLLFRPHAAMEIQRADPQLRRIAGLVFVALVVAGSVVLLALQSWLSGVAQAAPSTARTQLLIAFGGLVAISCVTLLAFAVCFWRTAGQVLATQQFPPPGMRVIRDTPVLRGAAAMRRGRILQSIGGVLVLCGVALAVGAWRLHAVFVAHAV
jgi:hypothetical protein